MLEAEASADSEAPVDSQPRIRKAKKKIAKKQSSEAVAGTKRRAKSGSAKGKPRNEQAKSKSSDKQASESNGGRHAKPQRPFPIVTVNEAMVIAEAIAIKHSGQPLEPEMIGVAVGSSWRTTKFFYLAAASRDYGLTDGGRDSKAIALTELGRQIVYPESAKQLQAKKIEAFFNVPLFKGVYDHYKGGSLPEMQFASGVLTRIFSLDASFHEDFCRLYKQNCQELAVAPPTKALGSTLRKESTETDDEPEVVRQTGKYPHRAFIIMPFSEKGLNPRPMKFFDEVFDSLITPACNAAGFGVETARTHGSDVIHHTIIRQLDEADVVIADLTDHNPNVLFELGIRIALDKPVLLIRAIGTPPIFDVDQLMRVCEYDPRLWKSTIESDIQTLADHVKGGWKSRESNPSYMRILKTGQGGLADAAS